MNDVTGLTTPGLALGVGQKVNVNDEASAIFLEFDLNNDQFINLSEVLPGVLSVSLSIMFFSCAIRTCACTRVFRASDHRVAGVDFQGWLSGLQQVTVTVVKYPVSSEVGIIAIDSELVALNGCSILHSINM